jgi:hypothetical protein
MSQENRTKMLAFSLAVLVIITTLTVVLMNDDDTEEVDQNLFKVATLNQIDRVVMSSARDTVELSYEASQWKVNGKFAADQNMVKVLFATLQQAIPRRPVANTLNDSLVEHMLQNGVKVSLYEQGQQQKSFYAGGNSSKSQGYFLNPEDNRVYLMNIPGYRVYVPGIFELDENGFRDKFVFKLNWEHLKAVSVKFPDRPQESFDVEMVKNLLTIKGISAVDTTKLYDFLDQVSLLTVDRYADHAFNLDSLKGHQPIMSIIVKDIAKEHSLILFRPTNTGDAPGLIGEEAAFFGAEKIRQVLRPKSFFIKK